MRDPLSMIGVPYVLNGTDPAVGLDCWSLVEYVRRECFGKPTPAVPPKERGVSAAQDAITDAKASGHWRKLRGPPWPDGSIVGLSISARIPLHHVGVALPKGVLHAWCGPIAGGTGSVVLTPWDRLHPWFQVVEVYECHD